MQFDFNHIINTKAQIKLYIYTRTNIYFRNLYGTHNRIIILTIYTSQL